MGSPYMFPPQEDYGSTYQRWNNYIPQNDVFSYLDPNDPEVLNYRNTIAQPSGADNMVGNFINSMPRMGEYNPSFMQRLWGIALGTLEGGRGGKSAYDISRNYVEEPYRRALADWKNEGQFIDDRARLLEADRNREIRSTEYALKVKNEAERRRVADEASRRRAVGVETGRDVANQDRDRGFDYRGFQDEIRNRQRDESLTNTRNYQGIINEMNNLKLNYMQEHGSQMPTSPSRPVAPPDVADRAKEMEANEKITTQAKNDAMNHPVFKQYFTTSEDGVVTLNPATPDNIKALISKFVSARVQNYKMGNSPDMGGF